MKISNRPTIIAISVFVISCSIILCLMWKELRAKIPLYTDLSEIVSPDFQADTAATTIEFKDGSGSRYQTPHMEREEIQEVIAALNTKIPIKIRFGTWRSPFPSKTIFSVYQLEIQDQIIIPYDRVRARREEDKQAAPMLMTITMLVAAFAAFIAIRQTRKHQRLLAHLMAKNETSGRL